MTFWFSESLRVYVFLLPIGTPTKVELYICVSRGVVWLRSGSDLQSYALSHLSVFFNCGNGDRRQLGRVYNIFYS